jgi:DNA-directed RNA polymerase subunit RPC12/RpoP
MRFRKSHPTVGRDKGGAVTGGERRYVTCVKCGAEARVDFLDLVSRQARFHCPDCKHTWPGRESDLVAAKTENPPKSA